MNILDVEGRWWIPDREELAVFGTLTLDDESLPRLRLFGILSSDTESLDARDRIPIVHGAGRDGVPYTLTGCLQARQTTNLFDGEGFSTSTLMPDFVYRGAILQTLDDMRFSRASFAFDHLDIWLGLSGFGQPKHLSPPKLELNYEVPQNLPLYEDTEVSCYAEFEAEVPNPLYGLTRTSAEIDQTSKITIESKAGALTLDEHITQVSHIRKFISVAIDYPLLETSVSVKAAPNSIALDVFYPVSKRQKRKLPRQVDNSKVEFSSLSSCSRNIAGGILPSESWGRISLYTGNHR